MHKKTLFYLLALVLLIPQVAYASGNHDDGSAGSTVDENNHGSQVATGQVQNFGQGATVELQLFPKSDLADDFPDGTHAQLLTVAVTSPGQNGRFVLRVDRAAVPADYIAEDGQIDARLLAMDANRVTGSWTFSAKLGEDGRVLQAGTERPFNAPDIILDMALGQDLPAAGARACGGFVYGSPHGPYQVKIGDALALGSVTGEITYSWGSSTSTTLGVASQVLGNWKASGTMTRGASSSVGFTATSLKDKRLYALWRYRDITYGCGGKDSQPYDYVGRGQTLSISHTNYSFCGGSYFAGNSYFMTSATNQTFSGGITVYGVSMTSQAGWSTSMSLKYTFAKTGNVCGNTSQREAAPRVEASTF